VDSPANGGDLPYSAAATGDDEWGCGSSLFRETGLQGWQGGPVMRGVMFGHLLNIWAGLVTCYDANALLGLQQI
jgi:hypothetical protein